MATIVENASKGQRKAMESLYGKNKQKIFYLAQSLLLNQKEAEEAVIWVFENLWSASFALKMQTEEEFTEEAVQMTVEYCRKRILKRDNKALRIPANKNFLIANAGGYDGAQPYGEFVLGSFPTLHRFIFVLHTLCGYDSEKMAKYIKISPELLSFALEAEQTNIKNLLKAAGADESYSCDMLADDFIKKERESSVPPKADEKVSAIMERIAKPAEQKKKIMMMIAGMVSAVCVCIAAGLGFMLSPKQAEQAGQESAAGNETEAAAGSYADIAIRDKGTITVKLDPEAAPITTENFINLAQSGFYNGLTFHRIMKGFMMQGGDPEGTGMGGSENTITGEFSENGYENPLSHTRGAIAMARSADYNSASSQFYIVHEDSLFLDGQYAVFGYVTEGMDIVDDVCESAEPTDDNGTIPADKQPVIESITIRTE